jgi:predicted Zn-dependent protease
MRLRKFVAFWVSLALATSPVATAPAQVGRPITLSRTDVQEAAQQHPQVVEQFGGTVDPRLNAYVASVGRRVADQTGVAGGGQAYTVTALNSPVLNAFALPGGYVYVTRELLAIMNDEAELAFVLGHEMGHVAAKHGQERQTRATLGALLGAVLGYAVGSDVASQLFGQVTQGFLMQHNRTQENQADTLGVRYLAASGYDATAAPRLLEGMGVATALDDRLNGRDQRGVPSWSRSHPLSAERVRRTSTLAASLPARGNAERNRDRFLEAIDGMLYGDDPKQGLIEDNQFIHPALRLRFAAPQGYGVQNGVSAITISGTAGQAQFGANSYQGSLEAYIDQAFRALVGNQIALRYPAPRRTSVNGIPAAYTTARVQTNQGVLDLSVFAYDWGGGRVYHFLILTRGGTGFGPFGPMLSSLRRLTPAEAGAVHPRVIDVVTVRPGDTVQSLANRMAFRDYPLERFLALNGLRSTDRLTPGQKVKLVVYG